MFIYQERSPSPRAANRQGTTWKRWPAPGNRAVRRKQHGNHWRWLARRKFFSSVWVCYVWEKKHWEKERSGEGKARSLRHQTVQPTAMCNVMDSPSVPQGGWIHAFCYLPKNTSELPLKLSSFNYFPFFGIRTESSRPFRSRSGKKKTPRDELTLCVCIIHRLGQKLDNVFLIATTSKYHLGTPQPSIFHLLAEGRLIHLENPFSRHYKLVAHENTLFPRVWLCLSFHIVWLYPGYGEPRTNPSPCKSTATTWQMCQKHVCARNNIQKGQAL